VRVGHIKTRKSRGEELTCQASGPDFQKGHDSRGDATLVKSYATDFCGVKNLREATHEQVENFVQHLSDWAEKDRGAVLDQLNAYLPRTEKEGVA
jgi:hypothetical protein